MGKKLYLECEAGISGDMLVAALIDLGADKEKLMNTLRSIPADGFDIRITRVKMAGLDCCDFDVVLDEEHENHDHDMAYLHGEGESEHAGHHHEEGESEHAGHHHEEGELEHAGHHHEESCQEKEHAADHFHVHHHVHRHLKDVLSILQASSLSPNALSIAARIFDIVAEAESKAHGEPKDEVHFHEVGAIDSIVDVAAIAACIDDLGIKDVIVPKLCEGTGTVRAAHGILPVPVPAVSNIVMAHGITLEICNGKGEFVTPTGAAAVAALRTEKKLPKEFSICAIGLGAGKRTYEKPSILRAMLIDDKSIVKEYNKENGSEAGELSGTRDRICKMETCIDDCSGEQLGRAMDRLLKAGARDVFYTPVFMKKNRPAYQLSVICRKEQMELLQNIIFQETTTIGIRYTEMERRILPRETETFVLPEGKMQIKVCTLPDGEKRYYPEYESVQQYCDMTNLSYAAGYAKLMHKAEEKAFRARK